MTEKKKLRLNDVLYCDSFGNVKFTGEMTEFDSVLLPTSLVLTANKYSKDKKTKIFHDKDFVCYMNGEELMKVMSKPTTLLMTAKKNLIMKYIKNESNIDIFPLQPDVMLELLKIETSKLRLVKFFREEDVKKLKEDIEIPESIKGWCNAYDYDLNEAIDESIEKLKKESTYDKRLKGWTPKVIDQAMQTLEELMNDLDFEVIHGSAGTGKSTSILHYLNVQEPDSKCMICTLSNTIGLMFKSKCERIENFSITKARFVENTHHPSWEYFNNNDVVVVDEFSQWGVESVDVLIKLIKCNKNAKFFFMGDKNQIPTFLSSGSLLLSIMDKWPNKVTNKTQLFRFQQNRQTMLNIINGSPINMKIQQYDPNLIKHIDCVITGTNAHVEKLNIEMVNQKFNVDCRGCTLAETIRKCINCSVEIICNCTCKIDNTKICCNERFTARQINEKEFDIVSIISKQHIIVNEKMLNAMFKLGYAITVNKAQGLEWRSTCVYMTGYDRNLMNHNALYVALSRSSTNLILLSESENKNNVITTDDVNNILKVTYKYQNLF